MDTKITMEDLLKRIVSLETIVKEQTIEIGKLNKERIAKARELDQFYTKPEIAKECVATVIDIFDIEADDHLFIEPAAGTGAFVKQLKDYKVLAFDINPKYGKILKRDFIKMNLDQYFKVSQKYDLLDKSKMITIGNPPFGDRGVLAKEFLEKSLKYCDTIAMILPMNFAKFNIQNTLDGDLKLVHQTILDPEIFIFDGDDYSVRTVFQVWTKVETGLDDLRIRSKPPTTHNDFQLYQYNNTKETLKFFNKKEYKWNFAVQRQGYCDYTQLITDATLLLPTKQWIFFKTDDDTVLEKLKSIDFNALSLMNTAVPGFGKADVVMAYNLLNVEASDEEDN